MKKIERIEAAIPQIKRKKRVAAYARVSAESDRLTHSLSAQISYYSELIQKNPEWEYAGVYADSFISGTSIDKRTEVQRMIADCEAGKINIILTKSISRFARNTVDLLSTVRHLKAIGVEVRFEKENICSMSSSDEIMLSILASFAQEESINNSENVKWAKRKRFEQGLPHAKVILYGYLWEDNQMIVVPEEADVVKRIYKDYMAGKTALAIAKELSESGITTKRLSRWSGTSINYILTNVHYTGNLLLQKSYVESPLTHKTRKNKGELPRYWVENTHEAIVSQELFDSVQKEMARRRGLRFTDASCFSRKIKCPFCGHSYIYYKDKNLSHDYWVHHRKKRDCSMSWGITQEKLKSACADVLNTERFDEEAFREQVKFINVPRREILEFHLRDGRIVTKISRNQRRRRTGGGSDGKKGHNHSGNH